MECQSVISSNLKEVCYDSQTSTLRVEFHNGNIYEYSNVSSAVYIALLKASSKGRYFEAYIKDRFPTRKVW